MPATLDRLKSLPVGVVGYSGTGVVLLLGNINVDLLLDIVEQPRPIDGGVASSRRIGLGASAAATT